MRGWPVPWRGVVAWTLGLTGLHSAAMPAPPLDCRLAWHARQPQALQFHLHNSGTTPLWVLTWGTPFEGWLQPYLTVFRDGQALPYQGPVAKRGDPQRAEYIRLVPGQARAARIDLAAAFDIAPSGHYRVESRIVLHDVHPAVAGALAARPRSDHASIVPDCPAVEFKR